MPTAVPPAVHGPEPLTLEGRHGLRYWVHSPYVLTGHAHVDERLSGYPVMLFHPPRPPAQTPVVLALQGMAAPCEWNGFLVPTLLDMGIACVLIDTPAAGERSLVRGHSGDVIEELAGFVEAGVAVRVELVAGLFEAVARDLGLVVSLLQERHGLSDPRRALFGVSLGVLLAGLAFARDGVGQRLLGTIGHANLRAFARSYTPWVAPLAASLPGRLIGRLAGRVWGPKVKAVVEFLGVLHALARRADLEGLNPVSYAGRVGPERQVRFLVGRDDPVVRVADAEACARAFADGECYPVAGLGHGGEAFVPAVRTFLETQLGDWRW